VTAVPSGTVVTLTATVTGGAKALTTGQVKFCDATAAHCEDIHILGTAQLTSAATATFKFRPGIGTHSYSAVFLGTTNYSTSTSAAAALTVTRAGLYQSVTVASPTKISVGNYTLAATVGGAGNAAPTGTVTFLDTTFGNAVLGTGSLAPGPAGLNFPVTSTNTLTFPSASNGIRQIAVGDFNGDGIPDLVLGDDFIIVTILLGNGDGTFTQGQTLEDGNFFAVADFNGDGILDLAVLDGNPGIAKLSILLGNGDGTFSFLGYAPAETDSGSIAVGDFNGDGIPDLAVSNIDLASNVGTVEILLGNGDGTFSPISSYGGIAVGDVADFNGDGKLDIVVSSYSGVTILLGNGNGTFSPTSTPPVINQGLYAVADFNGDGIPDLLTGSGVLIGDGTGNFASTPLSLPVTLSGSVALGDFTGDGIPDLAMVTGTPGTGTILQGNGDGAFTVAGTFASGSNYPDGIAADDFNGDGLMDLALISNSSPDGLGTAVNMLSEETQSSSASLSGVTLTPGSGTHQVVARYNGDGNYGTSTSSSVTLVAAQGTPTVSVTAAPNPVIVGTSTNLVATVTGAGVVPTGTVNFAEGSVNLGQGTLVNGVGTFPSSALSVGSHTITATYGGDVNYSTATGTGTVVVTGINLSASIVSFGSVNVGQTSAQQSVTVTNTLSTAVSISSIVSGGGNPSAFTISNNCGAGLAAGASCAVSSQFSPTEVGGLGATVTITDSAPGSPQTITLIGTGANPISLSAFSLSFGGEEIGTASASQSITVINTGNTAVSITGISVTGTNASSFVFGNNCPASLAVGANCSIHGHFAPTALGGSTAAITITDNAASAPISIALSGTGLGPIVTLPPFLYEFPKEMVGTSGASQPFALTNTGTGPLLITSIAVTGADASSFVFGNDCGASVAAGASCTIHGHFDPQMAGALTASVTITDNAPDSPQTIPLSGTGTVAASVALSATSLSFATVQIGTTSASQSVTMTNAGSATLAIYGISVTGTNPSSFVFANNCGASLAVGASCSIHGHFAPTSDGATSAEISINDNAASSPQMIALSGTGGGATVTFAVSDLSFGGEPVGSASGSQSFDLINTGNEALSIASITVTGADASSFVFANDCGTSLKADGTCEIHGHFAPTSVGPKTAAITFIDNGASSPQTIPLSGTGTGPGASLSATSLAFGSVAVGAQSGSESVTLTNSGAVSLSISSITVSGASSFDFANSCGTSLAAGANCSIHGHFAPTALGAQTATITITDNAGNSPRKIALSGTGAPDTTIALSATSLSFGLVDVGTASPSQSVTMTNTGTEALSITSITVSGAYSGSYDFANTCGTSLAPAANCTIHGHFKPQTEGALAATIEITDNASGSPQSISLSGTGQ